MNILKTKEYEKWFRKLKDPKAKSKIEARLRLMEFYGDIAGDFKTIDNLLIELRFDVGPGYRIYAAKRNDQILLLLGGKKSSQRRDIKKAKNMALYWKDNS